MTLAKDWIGFATKKQLQRLYLAWNVVVQTAKGKTVIVFPKGPQYDYAVGLITKHTEKSTYGETLYRIQLTNDTEVEHDAEV